MAAYFELDEEAQETAFSDWYESTYIGNKGIDTDETNQEFALWIEEEQPEFNDDGSRIWAGQEEEDSEPLIYF